MTLAQDQASHFVENEKEFHLGALVTEQPHPKTRGLSMRIQSDLNAGVRQLLSVEEDLEPVMTKVFGGEEYQKLEAAMFRAMADGKKIFFTGCGATGRLSILLDAMWRGFWQEHGKTLKAINADMPDREDLTFSVMAGGDYALIKSVEGFEDFPRFGKKQIADTGVEKDDVVVAITEGGETPFVIGTAWKGLEVGAEVFFVYNNPSDVLVDHVERSREMIEHADVTCLDLATGQMAIAGSTRMQATTAELLIVGGALESALYRFLLEWHSKETLEDLGLCELDLSNGGQDFGKLIEELYESSNIAALSGFVQFEHDLYVEKGRVTYSAERFLLDILTDTTERSPTFSLPPFRQYDDQDSPVSWAYVKHPTMTTPETWQQLLGRKPRCLDWQPADYKRLEAPEAIINDPPALNCDVLHKFRIGNEVDVSRYATAANALVLVSADTEADKLMANGMLEGFKKMSSLYKHVATMSVGSEEADALSDLPGEHYHISCNLKNSPMRLWQHLAVKLMLNTVSTAAMALIGRVTSNWMVCVQASNKKLIDRSARLIAELTGTDYTTACERLYTALEAVAEIREKECRIVSPVEWAIEEYGLSMSEESAAV
ncbi:sugar phosphate isomerase [Poriferisphaera sp. WC338]|uniref:sugar phosphate isomerase n=1 Tax=Poriferisphaera sp. WC338 TaxID=3425129 RepID=UPI003D81B918